MAESTTFRVPASSTRRPKLLHPSPASETCSSPILRVSLIASRLRDVDRVEESPPCVERGARSREHGLRLHRGQVSALCARVFDVEPSMHLPECDGPLLRDAVVIPQTADLRVGHRRDLPLVRVDRAKACSSFRAGFVVRIDKRSGGRTRCGTLHVLAPDTESLCEAQPQLPVVLLPVLLVPQVPQDRL